MTCSGIGRKPKPARPMSTIEPAGLGGLDGMKVDNIKPQVDRLVFPDVHRVIILASCFLHEPSSGAA